MQGLTTTQVQQKINNKEINTLPKSKTKSIQTIYYTNIVNYFNILNIVLALIIMLSGQIKNILFLGVVIFNTAIAIFQEVRSKKLLDKLSLLSKNKIHVIRDGKMILIEQQEIVLEDILQLQSGNQIPCDCIILEGQIDVDESNITGESDAITKKENDFLYSSTVITSGSVYAKVVNVGENNFANKVLKDAKAHKYYPSKLKETLNMILKIVTAAIIPTGILLFLKNYFVFKLPFEEVILKSVAPLIGMIPEGLILLTSVALAVSVFMLGMKKILIQELYCIETLARVDVLCIDKTGTITKGELVVEKVIGEIEQIMPAYLNAFDYHNISDQALIQHFGLQQEEIVNTIAFSSQRKYSAVSFKKWGTYVLGAYEFIITNKKESEKKIIDEFTQQGFRVLTLAKSEYGINEHFIPTDLQVVGYIVLKDVLRDNTEEIFAFFEKEKVEIKIISGDHPQAVSTISQKAGLKNTSCIDASELDEKDIEKALKQYNVFGRVTPSLKKQMVALLQKNHTVAMTGDGVNDVLALKQSDVSIAMAQGCDAAKQLSNIVLLENDFQNLYDIIMEGRRVINNIQKVATLFLNKTIYSIMFAIISVLLPISFPFIPIQLTLISALTIGIPSFFLTLKKSTQKIQKNFMKNVLLKSGISACSFVIAVILFKQFDIAVLLALTNGIILIYHIATPMNHLEKILIISLLVVGIVMIIIFPTFFALSTVSITQIMIVIIVQFVLYFTQKYLFQKMIAND